MLRRLDETDRETWASKVRQLLFSYGFGYVWIYEGVGDINGFVKAFKQRLIETSKQDWHSNTMTSSKARHYRYIMPTLQTARYIFYDIPIIFRIALTKLRCSVHKLHIETGRHRNINYEERLCILCDTNNIEDEFHFVIVCPLYEELRQIYLPRIVNSTRCLD